MIVLVQGLDVSIGFGVQLAGHSFELVCAAVAAEVALGEELDQVMVAMAGDATGVANSCLFGRVAGQAGVHGLSNVTHATGTLNAKKKRECPMVQWSG